MNVRILLLSLFLLQIKLNLIGMVNSKKYYIFSNKHLTFEFFPKSGIEEKN